MIYILFSAYSDNVDIYYDNSHCGIYEALEFHKGVVIYKTYQSIKNLTNYLYLPLSIFISHQSTHIPVVFGAEKTTTSHKILRME